MVAPVQLADGKTRSHLDSEGRLLTAPLPLPFALAVKQGLYPGISKVNKFGENPTIASGATEDVWDGSYVYTWPTTATITHIRAATNTATMRGLVCEVQGLDGNWDRSTQNATLNAADSTTEVALNPPLIRNFRIKVAANAVGDSNIWTGATGMVAGTAKAVVQAGNNQTLMALYSIPRGYYFQMTSYFRDYTKVTGAAPDLVEFNLWFADRKNGYEFQLKHMTSIQEGAAGGRHVFDPWYDVSEMTDIKIAATTSGAGAHVNAGFDGYLVKM